MEQKQLEAGNFNLASCLHHTMKLENYLKCQLLKFCILFYSVPACTSRTFLTTWIIYLSSSSLLAFTSTMARETRTVMIPMVKSIAMSQT